MRLEFAVKYLIVALLILAIGCSTDDNATETPTQPGNQAPVFRSLVDTIVAVGDTLRLSVVADDPERDPITYRLIVPVIPGGGVALADLNTQTGEFWFAARHTDMPVRWFGFFARDDRGNESSADIFVTVVQ